MSTPSHYGDTVFLRDFQAASTALKLNRVHFVKGNNGAVYNEAWLQNLIMQQPGLLPVNQIGESAFSTMVPVCTELRMCAGFMDNLFVTPRGEIAIVECKLWRNPEARRKVLAQILDYASEMSTWDYEAFETSIKAARQVDDENGSRKLFDIVSGAGEMDEVDFHDAVSRNLKRGRFLLLIVGDGIREGLETIANFFRDHASLHFNLAIIELALFELPGVGFIAQPRVLARTTEIGRFIVDLSGSKTPVTSSPPITETPSPRTATITQEQFLEDLSTSSPGAPERLLRFLDEIATYNVKPDFGSKTLTLRWHREDARDWNMGTIVNSGDVWMDYHAVQARNSNVIAASKQYLESLAALVSGASVGPTKSGAGWNVAGPDGHALHVNDMLADGNRRSEWVRAIARFEAAVSESSEG